MKETGLNLSHLYKETSEGGLARMYARRTPNLGPLRKFCVSDFRQKQEYHM